MALHYADSQDMLVDSVQEVKFMRSRRMNRTHSVPRRAGHACLSAVAVVAACHLQPDPKRP